MHLVAFRLKMLLYIICLHGSNCLPSSWGIPRISVWIYAVLVPNSELDIQGTALHIVFPYTTQTHPRPDKLCSLSEWKQPEHTPAWERLKQFPSLEKIWAFPSFCKKNVTWSSQKENSDHSNYSSPGQNYCLLLLPTNSMPLQELWEWWRTRVRKTRLFLG